MARWNGGVARQLDFGELKGATAHRQGAGRRRLRLAIPSAVLRGLDKYKVLEHRRHQAQIKARRLLDLLG
jgi:hypothetical protein